LRFAVCDCVFGVKIISTDDELAVQDSRCVTMMQYSCFSDWPFFLLHQIAGSYWK